LLQLTERLRFRQIEIVADCSAPSSITSFKILSLLSAFSPVQRARHEKAAGMMMAFPGRRYHLCMNDLTCVNDQNFDLT